MPGGVHQQYVELRESAMLGRIFDFANHIHDEIDAVVVIGRGRSLRAGRAIFQACCDPYHNELDRAERGSKPRMYFIDDDCDNDALSALLHRLRLVHQDQPACMQRFAIILVDELVSSTSIARVGDHPVDGHPVGGHPVAGHLVAELRTRLQTLTGNHCLGRYVMVVNSSECDQLSQPLIETLSKLGCCVSVPCSNSYQSRSRCDVRLETFAPATLLPAALLGLDCVKLLEGAVHAMEQSRSRDLRENQAMQFAASCMIADHRIRLASSSLNEIRDWYGMIRSQILGESVNNRIEIGASDGSDSQASTQNISDHENHSQTVHYWIAQQSRNDSLSVDRIQSGKSCPESWSDWRMDQVEQERIRLEAAGVATTATSLGTIDTYHLGWLFQMLMIATTLEAQAWETIQLNRAGQAT